MAPGTRKALNTALKHFSAFKRHAPGRVPFVQPRHSADLSAGLHNEYTMMLFAMYLIDVELSGFISAGRLSCSIDKVSGIVSSTRPDTKNAQYQATIKQGDLLLNRVQKLSRVIQV